MVELFWCRGQTRQAVQRLYNSCTTAGFAHRTGGSVDIGFTFAHLAGGHYGGLGNAAAEHIHKVLLEAYSAGGELVHAEEGTISLLGEAGTLGVGGLDHGEQVGVSGELLVRHVAAGEGSVLVNSEKVVGLGGLMGSEEELVVHDDVQVDTACAQVVGDLVVASRLFGTLRACEKDDGLGDSSAEWVLGGHAQCLEDIGVVAYSGGFEVLSGLGELRGGSEDLAPS